MSFENFGVCFISCIKIALYIAFFVLDRSVHLKSADVEFSGINKTLDGMVAMHYYTNSNLAKFNTILNIPMTIETISDIYFVHMRIPSCFGNTLTICICYNVIVINNNNNNIIVY